MHGEWPSSYLAGGRRRRRRRVSAQSTIDNRQSWRAEALWLSLWPFCLFALFNVGLAATSNLPRAGTPVGTFLFSSFARLLQPRFASAPSFACYSSFCHWDDSFIFFLLLSRSFARFLHATSAGMMCSKIAITAA